MKANMVERAEKVSITIRNNNLEGEFTQNHVEDIFKDILMFIQMNQVLYFIMVNKYGSHSMY